MKTALVFLFLCCQAAFGNYAGYLLFQTVPALAGSSPTSPYTLLISGTFPQFATTAHGGQILNTTTCGVNSIVCPADLMFATDSSCVSSYNGWDIASYSPTTGQLTVSVQIPILSNSRAIKIYGCAGNPAITTFQGGLRGSAYDSNYLLALHMDETSGITLHDSTANANNAVKKAANNPAPTVSGMVGGGQRFLGTANSANNDYALFGSTTAPANTYTIEYWTNASGYINQDSVFLENSLTSPVIYTGFYWYSAGTILYRNSWNPTTPHAPGLASAGTFHYVCFIRNGDTMNVFLDGVAGSPASGFGTGTEQWKGLGWDGGASTYNGFNGVMDEVFYSNIARSPDYIIARYNNLKSPSTFYTVSAFTVVIPAPLSTTRANSQVNIF